MLGQRGKKGQSSQVLNLYQWTELKDWVDGISSNQIASVFQVHSVIFKMIGINIKGFTQEIKNSLILVKARNSYASEVCPFVSLGEKDLSLFQRITTCQWNSFITEPTADGLTKLPQ